MRFDLRNQLSVDQVVDTSPTVSTNSIPKTAAQDLAIGQHAMGLAIFFKDATGATSFTVELIQADDAALTSNVEVLASTGAIALADLTENKPLFLAAPPYRMDKAYLGARYSFTGGSAQECTFNTYFGSQNDVAQYKSFNTSYNVDN